MTSGSLGQTTDALSTSVHENDANAVCANAGYSTLAESRTASVQTSVARLDQLDTEHLAVEEAHRFLRELHNRHAPIQTLPDEILLNILLIVRHRSLKDFRCWLRACTHSCRRLRAIALSCSAFWTRLHIEGCSVPEFVKTLLARSRNRSTHINIVIEESTSKEQVLQLVRELEFDRAQTLDVYISGDARRSCNEELISGFFDAPTPRLKLLKVDSTETSQMSRLWQTPVHLPPALESLHLVAWTFPWTSTIFDNLVELHLVDFSDPPSQLSLIDVQDLFARMHRVTSITFDRLNITDAYTSSVNRPPSLKHFSLLSPVGLLSQSTVYASHPTLSRVRLEADDLEFVFEFDHAEPAEVSCVLEHWSYSDGIYLDISTGSKHYPPQEHGLSCPTPDPPASFLYRQSVDTDFRVDECLENVCSSINFLCLAVCGLGDKGYPDDVWHSLFNNLDGLESLTLLETSISTILPCLVEHPSYFPKLVLFQVDVPREDEADYATGLDAVNLDSVAWIAKWLEGRKRAGLPDLGKVSLSPNLQDLMDRVLNSAC